MRATFDTKTARDALAVFRKHYGTRTPAAPALGTVELDASGRTVALRRTDLDTDVLALFDATVDAPGIVTVQAADLARAIPTKTDGPTTVVLDGDRLTITAGRASSSVRVVPDGEGLPTAGTWNMVPRVVIGGEELDRVSAVLDAAARGYDARAVLCSVAFYANGNGTGEAAATDTYRLHTARLSSVSGEPGIPTIVPEHVLRIAVGTADATVPTAVVIQAGDDRVSISYTSTKGPKAARRVVAFQVVTRAVEGPFPNYAALFPSEEDMNARWTVADAAGTAAALSGMVNRRNYPAVLTAAGSAVSATLEHDGTKTETVLPIAFADGDAFPIAFNPAFAADAFRAAGDGATVLLRDRLKAAVVDGGDVRALIMPMRVA